MSWNKNLKQTPITNFFKCGGLHTSSATKIKLQRNKTVKTLCKMSSEEINVTTFCKITKRKLAAPIYSEDEDSEGTIIMDNSTEHNDSLFSIINSTTKDSFSDEQIQEEKLPYNSSIFKDMMDRILKIRNLRNLLTDFDVKVMNDFFALDEKNQHICIKLFIFKRNWYNVFKFVQRTKITMNETEILDMYNCLKDKNFIETDYLEQDLKILLEKLSKAQLIEIAKSFKLKKSLSTKPALIEALLKNATTQSTLFNSKSPTKILKEKIKEHMGYCMKLSKLVFIILYKVYILGTFPNPDYKLPQDYFRSIYTIVNPPFKVEEDCLIFNTIADFTNYTQARICENKFINAMDSKNRERMEKLSKKAFNSLVLLDDIIISNPHLERYTAQAVYTGILSKASKHLTTVCYNSICEWLEYLIANGYSKTQRGFWYHQLSLVYMKYFKDPNKAAKMIITALREDRENLTEIWLYELANRANLLCKKGRNKISKLYHDEIVPILPPVIEDFPSVTLDVQSLKRTIPGTKRIYFQYSSEGDKNYMSVENRALDYYSDCGYPKGMHCENGIILTAFTVFFWDIIYDYHVKSTFVSEIQRVPLDMYSEHFYKNRKNAIDVRLKQIQTLWTENELKMFVVEIFEKYSHQNALVDIGKIISDVEHFIEITYCISRHILCKIFERLLEGLKHFQSGLPDLFVWNSELEKCKFIEVKSDNDVLSTKQKLWLNYLRNIGANVEVCLVHSIGTKKKKRLDS